MRFGVFGSADADVQAYLASCVEAERLGFHATFLVEHHFTGWSQVSAPLMVQACAAMQTTTLRLGTAVMVLPWHNPILLAEQAATLDVLSGGRVDLGVGRGYRHNEFVGFGIEPGEADARFREALDVILRAWSGSTRFSHAGAFWRFEDVVVEPAPVQRPHPPVWVAAASESSIRRAAQRGLGLILDQYASAAQIGERIAWYRSDQADPAAEIAVARQVYVAESPAEAEDALRRTAQYTQRTIGVAAGAAGGTHVLSYRGHTEDHALYGTADEVRAGLRRLEDVGVEYVLANIVVGGSAQLRRFAAAVMETPARGTPSPPWR